MIGSIVYFLSWLDWYGFWLHFFLFVFAQSFNIYRNLPHFCLRFRSWLYEQQYRCAEFHNLSSKLHFLNTSVTLVLDFPLKACDVRPLWLARSGIPLMIWTVLVQRGHPSAGAPERGECESQISPTWHTLHTTTRLPWCCQPVFKVTDRPSKVDGTSLIFRWSHGERLLCTRVCFSACWHP